MSAAREIISSLSIAVQLARSRKNRDLVRRLSIDAGELTALFTVEDVDRLICIQGMNYPGVRLLHHSEGLERRQYFPLLDSATRLYRPSRVLERFMRNGTTIKVSNVERRLPLGNAFFESLGGCDAGIAGLALFLSPPQARATIPHADDHPNLILQLAGSKIWRTWARFPEADIRSATSTGELQERFERAASALDGTLTALRPGDVLEVPTGVLHDAHTADAHSLSLSIQLNLPGQNIMDRRSDHVERVI